ncbi:unnamed protein product [Caenorhabditis bovis]|uniref:DUF3402 domain-containing protein n=1 Tax=Caenorhabditis bovis TaxID=2654633 RepID=A0A8S1EYV1_9PELO|nr:unnamed protein product [Caenorhabditis bovis]
MGIRPTFAEDVYGEKEKKAEEDQPEYSESSLAHRRSASIDKDLVFNYDDTDTPLNELAELYSYSEIEEFATNINCWKEYIDGKNNYSEAQLPGKFCEMTSAQKDAVVQDLCAKMESADSDVRMSAARCVLFILQGSPTDFAPPEEDEIQYKYDESRQMNIAVPRKREMDDDGPLNIYLRSIENAFICYKNHVYQSLCTLLLTEIKEPYEVPGGVAHDGRGSKASSRDSRHASNADLSDTERLKSRNTPTMVDNEMLRVIMAAIYHLIVQIPDEKTERAQTDAEKTARIAFLEEIQEPLEVGNEPLLIVLLEMLQPFYNNSSPHFPIKKMVLLIWKLLLLTLGGWDALEEMKQTKRARLGLPLMEHTLRVAAKLPAFVVNESDGVKNRAARSGMMARQMACADDGAPDDETLDAVTDVGGGGGGGGGVDDDNVDSGPPTPSAVGIQTQNSGEATPRAGSPLPDVPPQRVLPWKSKTTRADIEAFIQNGRFKYFDYRFEAGDDTTLFGLPPAFIGAVKILRQNMYTSITEMQIEREEMLNRYLFSMKEDIEETKTEQFYRKTLPNLSQYICTLVKVLVSSVPSSKARHEGLNILIDVLTPEMEASDILSNSISLDHSTASPLEDRFRLAIDISRHKEIIVKAISATLLLLVKHFKFNHVYQFEYLCQQIVYVNGIPLILKYLDQPVNKLIQSRNDIFAYNYPQVIYHYVRNSEEWPILTQDNIEAPRGPFSGPYYMWRNLFYSVNMIRLLNKLVKAKNDRVKMLMAFKSAPILKRLLRVRQSILQHYILKALKMQSRYLGRQWRKSNMEVISAIYSRVRHRMTDDWAFASDIKRKCDYQKEDGIIKACIERFHSRRYSKYYKQFAIEVNDAPMPGDDYLNRVDMRDFEPIDNCVSSVLGRTPALSRRFKDNYEKWMEAEVLRANIDWNNVLRETHEIDELLAN